jgi:ribosomal protein S18 acetylase RimI-like enzyme
VGHDLQVEGHVSLNVAGSEVAEDLARLWVRASAYRRRQPLPRAPEPERVAALATRVGRPGAAAVVAVEDDVTVACCFFEPLTEPDGQTTIDGAAHLSGVAVEPNRWGEGFATSLLVFAEAEVRRRGFRRFRLHVLEENERARTLYERLGWNLVATGHAHHAGPQAVYDKIIAHSG